MRKLLLSADKLFLQAAGDAIPEASFVDLLRLERFDEHVLRFVTGPGASSSDGSRLHLMKTCTATRYAEILKLSALISRFRLTTNMRIYGKQENAGKAAHGGRKVRPVLVHRVEPREPAELNSPATIYSEAPARAERSVFQTGRHQAITLSPNRRKKEKAGP